ncbi:MAG: hypothetical protein IPL69_19975 [Saprospiraceae bacterium]|nr:hypothetical protein [Candidatus Brachybacter algidus]
MTYCRPRMEDAMSLVLRDGFNGDNSIYLLKVDSQFTTGCNQGPTNLSVNSIALFDSSVTIQTTSGALQYPRTGMITASGGQNVILCFTTDISEVSAAQCSVFQIQLRISSTSKVKFKCYSQLHYTHRLKRKSPVDKTI